MDEKTIARVYLKGQAGEQVVMSIPGTNYQLHLKPTARLTPTPQGRVTGLIRCPGHKLDLVSAGGAYVEPLVGRPRRVQGHVIGVIPSTNSIVIEVSGTPIVTDLPDRYAAGSIALDTRVAVDVKEGSTFEPAPVAAAV
jgi:hypothetical protein